MKKEFDNVWKIFFPEQDRYSIAENRNVWNDFELTKQDIYYVYPEDDGTDCKKNPYSNV